MKRYLITAALALTVSLGYAQKAELAEAQKAYDAKNYQEAISAAQKAQDVISSNPAATSAQKAQAMYIKAASALELAGDDVEKVNNRPHWDTIEGILSHMSDCVNIAKMKVKDIVKLVKEG